MWLRLSLRQRQPVTLKSTLEKRPLWVISGHLCHVRGTVAYAPEAEIGTLELARF